MAADFIDIRNEQMLQVHVHGIPYVGNANYPVLTRVKSSCISNKYCMKQLRFQQQNKAKVGGGKQCRVTSIYSSHTLHVGGRKYKVDSSHPSSHLTNSF